MTTDMWITLGILVAAIIFFVMEWLRVDVVALGVVVALMLTDILTPAQAVAGFASTAVMTIAALFIVGGAVLQTGLATMLGDRILRIAGRDETRLIPVIMIAAAVFASFLSITGAGALLLPAIVALAGSAKISPSRLLIPLAFGALLGGALTLIGTPPNLIVNDMLRTNGIQTFNFFSFTPMGLLLLATGIIFMMTIGRRLIPDHKPKEKFIRVNTPDELMQLYRLPDNIYRLRVMSQSPLENRTLKEAGLGHNFGLTVLEIQRPSDPTRLFSFGSQALVLENHRMEMVHPSEDTGVHVNDVLLVQGAEDDMSRALADCGLALQPGEPGEMENVLVNQECGVAEVLVRPRSTFTGRTLREIHFATRFRLTVLSIRRPATEEILEPRDTRLKPGDLLLVQGVWRDILRLKREHRPDFVVLGQPEIEEYMGAPHRKKAPIALAILVGMLLLMALEIVPLTTASFLAALLMVLTGCLTMEEAYDSIDMTSFVLIAGMLPMATALEEVGLITKVADALTENLGAQGPLVVLAALFVITATLTQMLSNTATTVLIAPIALATAQQLDVHPHAFMMGVAIAASMAFATPVASPVNTLVMGAGSYRFMDYVKIGVPLVLVTMVVTLIFLPLLYPF